MSTEPCGCCEGTQKLTPMVTANRPGLDALSYRVGTHAAFLATMKARLSTLALEVPTGQNSATATTGMIVPLRGLTTRAANDAAIALLDGWATVADVLTFYQERIANEGYLRTATERRSVLELARLVGYVPRPGVAASVFLAYTIEPTHSEPVEIPRGARVQSLPGPGELPQSFETSEKLEARAVWNTLQPRLTRPQTQVSIQNTTGGPRVYLQGIATNLKPNDPILIDYDSGSPEFHRVQEVLPDPVNNRTLVRILPGREPPLTLAQEPEFLAREIGSHTALTVAGIVERYTNVDAFGVDPRRDMAERVLKLLQGLPVESSAEPASPDLISHLRMKALPALRTELALAQSGGYRLLEPWVGGLVEDLEEALAAASDRLAEAAALEFAPISEPALAPDVSGDILTGPTFPSIELLRLPPSIPPRSPQQLRRSLASAFQEASNLGPELLNAFRPIARRALEAVVANDPAAPPNPIKVYALRVSASLFGHNALREPQYQPGSINGQPNPNAGNLTRQADWPEWAPADDEKGNTLFLDAEYARILPISFAVCEKDGEDPQVYRLSDVQTISRFAYGMAGKSTKLMLRENESWWNPGADIGPLRTTRVHAQSEELPLAEEPITDEVCGDKIELADYYTGLQSGRWLIVSGERTDVTAPDPTDATKRVIVRGITAAELVIISDVVQTVQTMPAPTVYGYASGGSNEVPLPGDRIHTFLRLGQALGYRYRRDTVTINGNVVNATHGETRNEILGSGDATRQFQSFGLRQPPLTYLAAVTPAGVASSLTLTVNDVEWHEADTLAGLQPTDRRYVIRIDDDGKTTAIFGNGREGARLPTGAENIKAVYRNGIGQPGNVQAGQISLLATRPLGVKGVNNPLRASGGADRETRDQLRRNAPLSVTALDRLVSVQDYADFTRTFAGIHKASAKRLTDGRRELIHLTIAGADDIPIERSSDLYRNLVAALRRFGDPDLPIQVDTRELTLLVLSARVRLLPDYQWEPVVNQLRSELLDTLSFVRRDLGQDVILSQVICSMQKIEGVAFVDVDTLAGVTEKVWDEITKTWRARTPDEILAEIQESLSKTPEARLVIDEARIDHSSGVIRPAQLAFLTPNVPDTLILNQIG